MHTGEQQVPGLPTKALFPGQLQQQEAFTQISRQMLVAIMKLEPDGIGKLKQFLKDKLFSRCPEDKQPVLPDSPEDLMKFAEQYWNPLNVGFLKLLSTHLSNSELTRLVTEYEKALPAQLTSATWDSEAPVVVPQGYEIMVIRMKSSLTASGTEAVGIKDFLGKMKSLKGNVIILAGLTDEGTNIVFYIPASTIVSFFERLHHEKKSKAELHQRGVQLVIFPNQASLDVESGRVVYGSMVSHCAVYMYMLKSDSIWH